MAKSRTEEERRAEQRSCSCLILITSAIVLLFAVILFDFNPENVPVTDRSIENSYCCQVGLKYLDSWDYEAMNRKNDEDLRPLLRKLVKSANFQYFKVKVWCDCPLWHDDGMCQLRDCDSERFKKPQVGNPSAVVDRTINPKAFLRWKNSADNPWTNDDETDDAAMIYINLPRNPQCDTGYTGPSARKIWDAIYLKICPKHSCECQEARILYKLISGLHSSISLNIAAAYLLDEETNTRFLNLSMMYHRVLTHPERVKNLYFAFLFVLRAVKEVDYWAPFLYSSGTSVEDIQNHCRFGIGKVLSSHEFQDACTKSFVAANLWEAQCGAERLHQTQRQFREISALMDCMECENCRVWGKLQLLGLGTAMNIFMEDSVERPTRAKLLGRDERAALINLFDRLSVSVKLVYKLESYVEKYIAMDIQSICSNV